MSIGRNIRHKAQARKGRVPGNPKRSGDKAGGGGRVSRAHTMGRTS